MQKFVAIHAPNTLTATLTDADVLAQGKEAARRAELLGKYFCINQFKVEEFDGTPQRANMVNLGIFTHLQSCCIAFFKRMSHVQVSQQDVVGGSGSCLGFCWSLHHFCHQDLQIAIARYGLGMSSKDNAPSFDRSLMAMMRISSGCTTAERGSALKRSLVAVSEKMGR